MKTVDCLDKRGKLSEELKDVLTKKALEHYKEKGGAVVQRSRSFRVLAQKMRT